jgi:hypothetical protein
VTGIDGALASRQQATAAPRFEFEFKDLSEMVREGIPLPRMLVPDLLYENASHWFSGHPKHGKTILVMAAAVGLMHRGHHVIWLDYEGGERRTARRLSEHGARPDALAEFLHYQYAPRTRVDLPVVRAFEAALDRWPGALVVFDSQAKALVRAGYSEDSAEDVTSWTTSLVLHLTNKRGASVAVIDHMVKSGNRGSNYSRGSGAKAADADVSWFVECTEEFSRVKPGRIECVLWHDRDGVLPGHLYFKVGDGKGGLPVERELEPPLSDNEVRKDVEP